MRKEQVLILGSTGSIGEQTIDVLKSVGDKEIYGLACKSSINKLFDQVNITGAKAVAIYNKEKALEFEQMIKKAGMSKKIKIYSGMSGILELVSDKNVDIVVNSMVGMIGINPTIEAINHKKILCLANKEALVCAGDIIMPLARKKGVEIRPIDSEHSAIWQSLQGEKHGRIHKLIITASGGPFYGKTLKDLENVTVEDALKHPTWSMGKKITIDSATLVNKGLEVIEAMHLFHIPVDNIDVVVQRESLIHSLVEFEDGAIMSEMSVPSMRIPIAFALYKNERPFINEKHLNLHDLTHISLGNVDTETFKALPLAYKVARLGGNAPALFNKLDEIAVDKFLNGQIKFNDIVPFIEKGIESVI